MDGMGGCMDGYNTMVPGIVDGWRMSGYVLGDIAVGQKVGRVSIGDDLLHKSGLHYEYLVFDWGSKGVPHGKSAASIRNRAQQVSHVVSAGSP